MNRSPSLVLLLAAICALFAANANASASPAARAAAQPPPFHATIAAPVAGLFLGCCHSSVILEPTAIAVPRIGRAVVSGEIRFCGNRGPCAPEDRGTTLTLLFTTPSGDSLTLGGFTAIGSTPPLTWSVLGGTGRFADASGSGVYTNDIALTGDDLVATIELAGVLSLR